MTTWSSRGAGVFACSFITLFIAATTVILRFISRGYLCRVLRPSDWVIAVALLFSVATTVAHGLQVDHGLGKHIWDNPREEEIPMLKVVYANIILYNICATLTKLSILLMFTDIFHITTAVRRISWCMIVLVSLYGVYMTLTSIFFCYPIALNWTPAESSDDRSGDGSGWCFVKERKYLADASVNIVLDFVIWALPMPVVRGMKSLGKRERGWLFGVFGVGFFICIVSIIRLYSLKLSATSTDPSYDNASVTCWSAVELNLSITIACIMTLKPLISRVFPRLLHNGLSPEPTQDQRASPHERRLKQRQRQMQGRNGGAKLQKKRRMSERIGQAAADAGRRMSGGVMSVMSGRNSQVGGGGGFSRRHSSGGFVEMRDMTTSMDFTMNTDFSEEHPATISSPPPRRGKKKTERYGSEGSASAGASGSHRHIRPMGKEEEEVLGMTGLSSLDGSRWLDDETASGDDDGGGGGSVGVGNDVRRGREHDLEEGGGPIGRGRRGNHA